VTEREAHTCRVCGGPVSLTPKQIKKAHYECRPCGRERERAYRKQRREAGNPVKTAPVPIEKVRARAQTYGRLPHVRQRRAERAREYLADPEHAFKNRVRRATRHAIAAGAIKVQPCEVCGETKVDAHHDDYSKPLEVRFLCRYHHTQHHKAERSKSLAKGEDRNG
jgi:hypothetical protein